LYPRERFIPMRFGLSLVNTLTAKCERQRPSEDKFIGCPVAEKEYSVPVQPLLDTRHQSSAPVNAPQPRECN